MPEKTKESWPKEGELALWVPQKKNRGLSLPSTQVKVLSLRPNGKVIVETRYGRKKWVRPESLKPIAQASPDKA